MQFSNGVHDNQKPRYAQIYILHNHNHDSVDRAIQKILWYSEKSSVKLNVSTRTFDSEKKIILSKQANWLIGC